LRRPFPLHALACAITTAILSAQAAGPRFDISAFAVRGNTLLAGDEVQTILKPYTGPERDFADVQRAVAALQAAYERHGFNLVRVALPEQELDRGVVRIEVTETRIGKVSVEGNRYFDDANIRRSLPGLVQGAKPDVGRISASLAQANENPAKKTTLDLKSGREGEADAVVSVVDERPWRVSLDADNTGDAQTGRTLLGVVYQNADVAGRDQVASLQYTTTAERPRHVSVYGAGYHIPIYALGDSIDLYANHSDIDSAIVLAGAFDLRLSGRGTVAGVRYNHWFSRAGDFQSGIGAGIEHKAYRNGAVLLGVDLGGDVTVHPASVNWWGTWKGAGGDTTFTLSGVRNIPGGNNASDADFERARAGAKPGYALLRYGAAHNHPLPGDWQARVALQGQYSRDALVPGEQFGAGGVGSVRGFDNRDIAGDSGVGGTAEIYTPDLCARWSGAYCRALAFYDAARVTRNDALPGEPAHASIASAGLGLRAAYGRYAILRLDWGHVLDSGFGAVRGDNQVNFRLSLTY
jgi:hemolysin activation/secretion protein